MTATLLTLDVGSVLYSPVQPPQEIVTRHKDGEVIKATSFEQDWGIYRRDEHAVNFRGGESHSTFTNAVGMVADRQAFGFRLNGESVNPLKHGMHPQEVETIELEGLDLGGVVIEDERHLPLSIFTTDEVYYRIYIPFDDDDSSAEFTEAVLDRREGPHGEWTEVKRTYATELGYLFSAIADETDMVAVTGGKAEVSEELERADDLFVGVHDSHDEEIRDKTAVQKETAFEPNMPKPRRIEFQ